MYYTDSDRSVFLSSELMTKMTQKKQRHIVSLTMACHFAMIIRNEVKMSKYFHNPIFPQRGRLFPLDRGHYFLPSGNFFKQTHSLALVFCVISRIVTAGFSCIRSIIICCLSDSYFVSIFVSFETKRSAYLRNFTDPTK